MVMGSVARAQEPVDSEFEFVRKLRAKGYAEFAKAYLDRMEKRNDPKLAGILPLEQARTLLAVAREKEAEQRFGIFGQAREFLKDYTAKNAGKPEAAQGTLELARLAGYEGQALLTKAMRELDVAAQQELANPATTRFAQAGVELDAAIKMLQGLIDDPKTSDTAKKQLQKDLIDARFDKAINYIDQARTYVNKANEDVNLNRAKIVEEARKVFVELKGEAQKSISAQANAWLMKIAMEQQDPNNIEKYYNSAMAEKDAESRAGHRWARLFDMQDALVNGKNPRVAKLKTAGDKLLYVQKAGQSWLKDYPGYINAPEGQAVLWELGMIYYTEGKEAQKERKKGEKKIDPEPLLNQAQKYFGMLAVMDGDFSEKAKQHNLSISFERMKDKKDFRTFEELYLKGQFELIGLPKIGEKLAKARAGGVKKDVDSAEKEWKTKLRAIAGTFSRAIALADDRTPIAKLDEARYYLTSAFLLSGDLQRAAVAGEALGKTKPPTRRASAGAGYAIECYDKLLAREQNEGTKERLKGMIEFVLLADTQKYWGSDPVTSVARYQMAMVQLRDGNIRGIPEDAELKKPRVKGAIEELENLPKEFPAYIYAQGQLVFIALKERRENQRLSDKEKKVLTETVRKALIGMPALPNEADSSTAYMYFLAQTELSKLLYSDAYDFLKASEPLKAKQKYTEMGKFLADLATRVEKMPIKLDPKNRTRIDFELKVMQKYATLGLAEVEYREGKFDKVIDVTKLAVAEVKKADDGKGGPIKLKAFQVVGDTLGLALRAEVRQKNLDKAKELLDLLKRLADDEEDPAARADGKSPSERVVGNLLSEIASQIGEAKKEKDDTTLKELVGTFSSFLETLLKDVDPKKMPKSELRTLAEAFSSLDQHAKAAELLAQYPVTKLLESKVPIKDLKEEELKELAEYWSFQWELAKEYRKAKNHAEALKVVDRWLKHDRAFFKMPQGQMEKNFILEDDGKYGAATMGWKALSKALLPKVANDNKMKQFYFDAYFYGTRTLFEYGMKDPAVKSKEKVVDLAAKTIVDLEFANNKDGWERAGPRFQELLTMEPILKEAYDRLRANRKK